MQQYKHTIEKELRPGGILSEDKMALGFSTGSSFGNRTIVPDKGMSKAINLLFYSRVWRWI